LKIVGTNIALKALARTPNLTCRFVGASSQLKIGLNIGFRRFSSSTQPQQQQQQQQQQQKEDPDWKKAGNGGETAINSKSLLATLAALGVIGVWISGSLDNSQSPAEASTEGEAPLDLELLYHPDKRVNFSGKPPQILNWLADNAHYAEVQVVDGEQRVVKVHARTGEVTELYDTASIQVAFNQLEGVDSCLAKELVSKGTISFSPDENAVMVQHKHNLYFYHFVEQRALKLTNCGGEEDSAQVPAFSPDGAFVSYVQGNNLCVVSTHDGKTKQLTHTGHANLFNGILDWVYQEEVYGRGNYTSYWWSPDSSKIAFLELDEAPVPSFTVVDHIPQHLTCEVTRYPKSGDPNPNMRLAIVDVKDGETTWAETQAAYQPCDTLFVHVAWRPDSSKVVVQLQNKEQTWLDLNDVDVGSGRVSRLFREQTQAWVNVLGPPVWLPDGGFVWRSEKTGFAHLYRHAPDGSVMHALTDGEWEVEEFYGVDTAGYAYFSGTCAGELTSHVFRVSIAAAAAAAAAQSPGACPAPTQLTDGQGTHTALFNHDFSLFVNGYSSVATPTLTDLKSAEGRLVRRIDTGKFWDSHTKHLQQLPSPEFRTVYTSDGFPMSAVLIKPPDFDASKQYPVLYYQYSGPHHPQVKDRWGYNGMLWHRYMATQGYVVFLCDCRTSSGKGMKSCWPLHRNFGELEHKDILDAVGWLKGQKWVDNSRVGIWGWSYGGYMTLYCLTHSDAFKIGISGAPVTDWKLYDTIYTERYMGTPQSNPEGYANSSLLHTAKDLSGKLLLVHGTMDDNVHLQNSIQMIYELQKAGKDFDFMVYPKSRHGVAEPHLVYHLRSKMTDFIKKHL